MFELKRVILTLNFRLIKSLIRMYSFFCKKIDVKSKIERIVYIFSLPVFNRSQSTFPPDKRPTHSLAILRVPFHYCWFLQLLPLRSDNKWPCFTPTTTPVPSASPRKALINSHSFTLLLCPDEYLWAISSFGLCVPYQLLYFFFFLKKRTLYRNFFIFYYFFVQFRFCTDILFF